MKPVNTPILDLAELKEHIYFDDCRFIVIDEADTMLSHPFLEDMKRLILPFKVEVFFLFLTF
jgi:superfamily II DNA/RNA helicase